MADFATSVRNSYQWDAPSIDIGNAVLDGKLFTDLPVRIPLSMMNRHGLIAGSTGTGKSRSLQLLAEGLSRNGVPSLVADIKGDLAGLSRPGEAFPKILERVKAMGREFRPEAFPTEFYSLTGVRGTQIRATVSSFGPVLLGKVLELTDTQQSVLAMVFKYCDDQRLPLLDFKDLRDALLYLKDHKEELEQYGGMSPATVGVLVRKLVELEQQGAQSFFGEPELDISDLMRVQDGKGVINVISLADVQDKPRLYSTFMMWLLGQFYFDLPEAGDLEKPKLVFFFDEAHQLFEDASSALVEHIEQVARLIRSKGIGVFFITQTPKDIDNDVLAQLGNRVQHAVRAFTPQDAKDLKSSASTFPPSSFYKVEQTLTSLGIGEALVSVLNPKGIPTEAVHVRVATPSSSMGTIEENDYDAARRSSRLAPKYARVVDRESAHEILSGKLARAAEARADEAEDRALPARTTGRARKEKTVLETVMSSSVGRQAARTVTQQVIRGLFGLLKR